MNKAHRTDLAIIVIVALLAFGSQILWLGFFQDDWNFVFFSSVRGTQGLLEFLVVDGRPGATWVYALGFALLGYEPALWQFFSLLLRILTTIMFWMILNSIWPGRRYGNLVATLFFLAYPFFTLQPLSVAYAPHLMAYLLYVASVFLMIRALQKPEKYLWFTIPAILLTFTHLFTVEYFVGLEFLRLFIIWFLLNKIEKFPFRTALNKVFMTWLPYLLILVYFTVWRSTVLANIASQNDPLETFSNSGQLIISVVQNMFADWVLMFFSSWFNLIKPETFVIGPVRNLYFLAITLIGALFFYILAKPIKQSYGENHTLTGVLLAGLLIFAVGMISAYSIGYVVHIKTAPWNSRFVLPGMGGLALLAVVLVEAVVTSRNTRHVLFAILVGLLIGWHNNNTLSFKSAWEKQTRLYEQLIWRAPSIKPGTAVIASEEILGYMGDYPTSFGLNTIYEAKQVNDVPLWFFAFSGNYSSGVNQAVSTDELASQKATVTFRGKKQDALIISYEPENKQCLWVLRPQDSEYRYLPENIKEAARSAHNNSIQFQEGDHSLYHTIVNENRNTWCFYYQKADLARQQGDWQEVAALWQEAQSKGLGPDSGFEFIPFIEAYAHLGKWENAYLLTKSANRTIRAMYFILCPTWESLGQETGPSPEKNEFMSEANDLLKCVPES
jgi:hypothetical protein